jgi:hypothetical protein
MSRPQKIHKPLKGGFNEILDAVAIGSGKGKQTAKTLVEQSPITKRDHPSPSKPEKS